MKLEKYRLLLSTIIPVYRLEGRFYTNKLWWRDLEEQLRTVDQLCLVAPEGKQFPTGQVQLDSSIRVITNDQILSLEKAKELVKDYDVIQVASGVPWWQMLTTLRLSSAAKKRNKCLILSISSNRYRTTLLNAKKKITSSSPLCFLEGTANQMDTKLVNFYRGWSFCYRERIASSC